MESLVKAVVMLAFAAPVISFAQGDEQSVTRAQVRAELVQAEDAGYSPTAWAYFPYGEVQAAEYRVAARREKADPFGRGATTNESSQSGDIAR
ncbi:purine nucleoside phosphorylase [Caballeronia sordidicola]|uniref:Purine nucleoside phosphorylase n=1 Tax=Caballeronia sordidicola TaxID=196367 RepID=A0A158IFE8_CABSO|nr:DUF4148 domain-containing protein [Caballeronia sordidicola]SAL55308.1 purine nucleoside phosphorylase [Caballeronia sordidicola]